MRIKCVSQSDFKDQSRCGIIIPHDGKIPQAFEPIWVGHEVGKGGVDPKSRIADMRSIGVEAKATDCTLCTGYTNRTNLDSPVVMMRAMGANIGQTIDPMEAE